jgi:hypothetical protein
LPSLRQGTTSAELRGWLGIVEQLVVRVSVTCDRLLKGRDATRVVSQNSVRIVGFLSPLGPKVLQLALDAVQRFAVALRSPGDVILQVHSMHLHATREMLLGSLELSRHKAGQASRNRCSLALNLAEILR